MSLSLGDGFLLLLGLVSIYIFYQWYRWWYRRPPEPDPGPEPEPEPDLEQGREEQASTGGAGPETNEVGLGDFNMGLETDPSAVPRGEGDMVMRRMLPQMVGDIRSDPVVLRLEAHRGRVVRAWPEFRGAGDDAVPLPSGPRGRREGSSANPVHAETAVVSARRERRQLGHGGNPSRRRTTAAVPPAATAAVVSSDSQNVHDPMVAHDLRRSFDALPRPPESLSLSKSLSDLRNYISKESTKNAEVGKAAERTLTKMEMGTTPLTYLPNGGKEVDVLHRVWSATVVDGDDEASEDRRRLLLQQMAEADGVCVSGRVARVLGSLDGVDDRVTVRPRWALRRELLDRSAVVARETGLEGKELEHRLREEFHRDYVATGIAPARLIDAELREWAL